MLKLDPRIHAALNCGSNSCPPVGIYKSELIDTQLEESMKTFVLNNAKLKIKVIESTDKNQESTYTLQLNDIFRMYLDDFTKKTGNDKELIN